MLVQSPGPRVQESECWPVTNAKPHVVRRVSRSGSLRPVSTAQKVPPKKEPQESRRDRLERAITSFRTPARAAAQKLQQKASEVDSSRVSGAIQNLINSWKASDSQADQDAATTSSQAPQNEGDSAGKAGPNSSSLNPPEQSGNAQPAEDEKQQEKSNRLLSLFSRGKNGQQQPEEMMPVRGNHPALQLLRQRAAQNSLPFDRKDKFKLGLVVEGGGMRGAVSAGGLLELGNLGFRQVRKECFDAVYGSSAGAINATYFLSGQREGVRIYYEDIANKQFVDLSRLLDRKNEQGPVLNLSFLMDHVMEKVKPLFWDAVLDSPIPLKGFESKEDLVACLKASANVPRIAGEPLQHRGQRLVDAAVFEAVPFRVAVADGCTHIITLCTRPPFKGNRIRKAVTNIFFDAIKRAVMSPSYMKEAWQKELEMIAEDGLTPDEMLVLGLEEGSHQMPFFSGCNVYPIFPGAASKFPPVCIDVDTLIKGVEEGQLAVRRALTPYAGSVPPAAVSDSPQSSSRASESESLDMLESLASAELDDESGSSGDESDEEADQSRAKLQERYKWLVQQRAALQQQLEKLQNGGQTKQKESK
ncbi:MAG: patatin-like phospholipase [Trebouxia sp. A1-2]|nr:MAG: patatin-like phospholipase [Trebouxia sp. A1-2]